MLAGSGSVNFVIVPAHHTAANCPEVEDLAVCTFNLDQIPGKDVADPYAIAGSGIEVMVGIQNEYLQPFAASSIATDAWVKENLTDYMGKGGVNFK